MANELWGWGGGDIAVSESNARVNAENLKSLHQIGEIQKQPYEMANMQALTRFHNAQSAEKESALRDQLMLQAIESKVAAARVAQAQAGQLPEAQAVTQPTPSAANPLLEIARVAQESGLPQKVWAPIVKDATLIKQREAAASHSQAAAAVDAAKKEALVKAEQAQAAQFMLDHPEAYASMRMAAIDKGIDVSKMPSDWNAARVSLEKIVSEGRDLENLMKERAQAPVRAAQIKRAEAQAVAADAAAGASTARKNVLTEELSNIKKFEGDKSKSIQELRKARKDQIRDSEEKNRRAELAKAEAQKAREAAKFDPPTPAEIKDPKLRKAGKTYYLPSGAHTWSGTGWIPLHVAPSSTNAPATITSDAEASDSDDDEDTAD